MTNEHHAIDSLDRDGRALLDGTLGVLLADGLFPLTATIGAMYLTRQLDRAEYGTLSLCVAIVVWIQWSITALFRNPTIKFIRQAQNWRPIGQTVLRQEIFVGGVAALGLAAAAAPAARALHAPALTWALRLLALDIPVFCAADAHQLILIGLGKFRSRAIASTARWSVRLLLIIALVECGFGLAGALIGLIGASVAELAVCRYFVRPPFSAQAGFPLTAMFGYVAPLFVFSMSMRLFDRTDLLMVTWPSLGGSMERAGLFSAAQQLALLPALFAGALGPLLLSTLSDQLARGKDDAARAIAQQGLRAALLLLPVAALVAALARSTVTTVFGTPFESAAPLLGILFFASCARVVVSIGVSILTAIGRPGLCSWVGVPMWLAVVALQLLTIPRFGMTGAAAATTTIACSGAIATMFLLNQAWNLRPPFAVAARSMAVSVLVFGVAVALPDGRTWVVANYVIGVAVIVFAFLILGEFTVAERLQLRSALGRLMQPTLGASEAVQR